MNSLYGFDMHHLFKDYSIKTVHASEKGYWETVICKGAEEKLKFLSENEAQAMKMHEYAVQFIRNISLVARMPDETDGWVFVETGKN